MAANQARYPLVLFSHGSLFRACHAQKAEESASHGYVVVAPDHPDCWASEFPDGLYLTVNRSGDNPG